MQIHIRRRAIKKAIIFGNNTGATYHPLDAVKGCFEEILSSDFVVQLSEQIVSSENLAGFHLCLIYYDLWDAALPSPALDALDTYVESGCGVLIVHNGISLQSDPRFCTMIGAKFISHPPRQRVCYFAAKPHAITQGMMPFEIEEELYMFEDFGMDRFTVLIQGKTTDHISNALWVKSRGRGRIAYFAIGHDSQSFLHPTVRTLLINTAIWSATTS